MRAGRLPKPTDESLRDEYPDPLERAIAVATAYHRHVHAANYPCRGCVERAARAARRVTKEKP